MSASILEWCVSALHAATASLVSTRPWRIVASDSFPNISSRRTCSVCSNSSASTSPLLWNVVWRWFVIGASSNGEPLVASDASVRCRAVSRHRFCADCTAVESTTIAK